ncbi:MAG: hypothetical protein PWQ18_550 [Clostridia bacterium]|nr:hypothetical protein [Clostridia bacterium]
MNELQHQLDRIRQRRPLRDTVYQYLKESILAGRYSCGQRLMEAEIATELNISRTPVREAFRKLEQEGLVSYEPGRGIVVLFMGAQDMLEIYAIMVALEGMAARLAAENITAAEIGCLEQLQAAMETALEDNNFSAFQKAHWEFNQTIFRSTRNRHLFELFNRYHDYIVRTEIVSWRRRYKELKKEHQDLLAAIKDRDKEKAEKIMRVHVEDSRQAYLQGEKLG